MTTAPVLTSARLVLTPVTAQDLPDLVELWSDTDFTRFIMGRALSEEEVWFRLLRDIGHWQAMGYGNWSIRTQDGTYAGSIGLFDYRRELEPAFDAPEAGWGIAPQFQGKGVATEALELAMDWADNSAAFPRTVCMISPDNVPSVRMAERKGYHVYAKSAYKGSAVNLYERFMPNTASRC